MLSFLFIWVIFGLYNFLENESRMGYKFKTEPFKHQLEVFNRTKDYKSYALFWEQGCGKTKPIIDTVGHLYLKGEIDTLLVVAPKGVHVNWIYDEIPTHLSDEVQKKTLLHFYESSKANNKTSIRQRQKILAHKGFSVVAINYDAFITKNGKEFMKQILEKRECFYVLDESHYIKSESAQRTKIICKSGTWAKYKRILTGTPISVGPFDLYSQISFLDMDFWKFKKLSNYFVFKKFFGVFKKQKMFDVTKQKERTFDQLVSYKNLHIANSYFDEIGDRLTKEEAGLNLPPKVYSKRYFEMSSEQNRLYHQLEEEFSIDFEDGFIDASLALVRLLRAQQITSGYLPTEEGELIEIDKKKNARLDCLCNLLDTIESKTIIWARFTKDIDHIMNLLGDEAVRHDGQVSDENEKANNRKEFQLGSKKYFVANPQGGSAGFTLTSAKNVIYYSNSFKLIDRLQSEDRAHRIGQKSSVNYIDISTVQPTVDHRIIESLRNKVDIASQITGDKIKQWI